MGGLAQGLLTVSYAVLAVLTGYLLPDAIGLSQMTSNLVAVAAFFGCFQLHMVIRNATKDTGLREQLHQLEAKTQLLRSDLERTRRDLDRTSTDPQDRNSAELLSELKVLHTLLDQVMRKQAEAETKSQTPTNALQIQHSPGKSDATTEPGDLTANPGEKPDPSLQGAPQASAEPENGLPDALPAVQDAVVFDSEAESTGGGKPPASLSRGAPILHIQNEEDLLGVIQSALSENRVDLYLQPIVTLPTRQAQHFECFSRVRDESGRVILPRHYMDVAAERGLVGTIDNLLLFRLIQLLRRLGPRRPNVRFFCNLSRHSLNDEEFFPQFIDFMVANDSFASRLVFEIAREDYDRLDPQMHSSLDTLVRRGFQLSLDRVQEPETLNKAALKEAGVDYIKVEHSALKELYTTDDLAILVASFNAKGLELIVTRTEREDDVIELNDGDMRFAQGYIFGEPAPASEFDREL